MTEPRTVPRTNVLALVGFLSAFMIPVAGFVLGAMATRQISVTHEGGRGLARWAIVIGLAGTLFGLAFFAVWLSLFIPAITAVNLR